MENIVLLTVEDLAKRWQVNERTIRKYIENGTLGPCKNVPGIRFNPVYIEELEGIEIEKHSSYEFRILEKNMEKLKMENEELKSILREYQTINIRSLKLLTR